MERTKTEFDRLLESFFGRSENGTSSNDDEQRNRTSGSESTRRSTNKEDRKSPIPGDRNPILGPSSYPDERSSTHLTGARGPSMEQ